MCGRLLGHLEQGHAFKMVLTEFTLHGVKEAFDCQTPLRQTFQAELKCLVDRIVHHRCLRSDAFQLGINSFALETIGQSPAIGIGGRTKRIELLQEGALSFIDGRRIGRRFDTVNAGGLALRSCRLGGGWFCFWHDCSTWYRMVLEKGTAHQLTRTWLSALLIALPSRRKDLAAAATRPRRPQCWPSPRARGLRFHSRRLH